MGFITSSEEYEEVILKYREKGYEYLEELRECLTNKTADSIRRFLCMYQEGDMLSQCMHSLAELSYGHIFAVITVDEIRKNGRPYFIMQGNSLEELIELLKQIEFALWELEFENNEAAQLRMKNILRCYDVTPSAVKSIITVAGMDKRESFLQIVTIYLEDEQWDNAVALMECAVEYFPEDREIIDMLDTIKQKLGR